MNLGGNGSAGGFRKFCEMSLEDFDQRTLPSQIVAVY